MDKCNHPRVTIHSRLVACATRYEPAEFDQRAECLECGEILEIEDIPEDSEVKTDAVPAFPKPKGYPHEHYD